jgi:hypothetical protein
VSFNTDLATFMAATRRLESGSFQGNYSAQGRVIPSGNRALGAYQIMSHIWDGWASKAGIPGANWRDPAAQDRVARMQMTEYYNAYQNWQLVAVAWYAGGSRARRVLERFGHNATNAQIASEVGSSIADYANKVVNRYAVEAPQSEWGIEQGLVPLGSDDTGMETPTNPPRTGDENTIMNPATVTAGHIMRSVLTQMADATAGGLGNRLAIEDVETQRIAGDIDTGGEQDGIVERVERV